MVKKCNKCKEIKDVSEFGIESRAKNGFKPRCKDCTNKYYREKYNDFKENKSIYMRERLKNQDTLEKIKKQRKKYRELNKEKLAIKNKEWYDKNSSTNEYKKKKCEYIKNLNMINKDYNIQRRMRALIYRLKIYKKTKTSDVLGYTYDELIKSLGSYPNKKEAIDHKIPVSWFIDLNNVKIINSLENLQIISRSENSKKCNLYCHPVSKKYYDLVISEIKDEFKEKLLWKN